MGEPLHRHRVAVADIRLDSSGKGHELRHQAGFQNSSRPDRIFCRKVYGATWRGSNCCGAMERGAMRYLRH
jgi:hypothetical protein